MEDSESSLTRIGRTMWTVWGYLTGAVGRYLRPEVTNEPNPNAHSEREPVIMTINKSYRELKEKEEEVERSEAKTWNQHERKMREVAGLQHSGVKVRTAAAQWEKVIVKGDGDGDHDEDCGTSKNTCSSTARSTGDQSSENAERTVQLRCNETLDYNLNINHEAKIILSTDLVKQDREVCPSVITNVNTECQECEGSGGKNPGVDANMIGNNQEQRGNSEKERSDYIMECVVDRIEIMDSEDVYQGLEHEHEQVNRCHQGDKVYINETSVVNAIDYANNQDINVENIDRQRHQEKANNEDKNHKSQMEDEDLSLLIHPKCDPGNLLKAPTNEEVKTVIYKEEVSTNKAKVAPESQAITNMETEPGTIGKIKLGQLEDLTASVAQQLCKFTGTEIFDKQEVYGSKKHEAETEHNDNQIEVACELMEFGAAQMENADINKKETEPCSNMGLKKATFADVTSGLDTNLLTVTMESVQLKQLKEDIEVTSTSKATLKTEDMQLDETDCVSGSQRLEVIEQGIESVVNLKSKCKQDTKAEVSSKDIMKSTMVETILREHFTDREETVQETVYQCTLEQDPGQEEPANGKINESGILKAPFSEMLKDLRGSEGNSVGQPDETAIKSTDEMLSLSLQELDKTQCSADMSVGSEPTELIVETKTVSIEQKLLLVKHNEVADACKPATTGKKGQQAEFETDTSKTENELFIATTEATSAEAQAPVLHDMSKTQNILRDQQNYSECMAQDKSGKTESYGPKLASYDTLDLPDWESPLKTLEMWRNSQKDMEEDKTIETAPYEYEIMAMEVLEEVMSGLTKESKEMQSDLSRQTESPDNSKTETEGEMIELLNDIEEHRKDLQGDTMNTGSETCGQFEEEKMAQYTSCEIELNVQITEEGKSNMLQKQASVLDTTPLNKKDHEDKVDDNNEDLQKRNRPGLKRGFEKMERGEKEGRRRGEEKDKPSLSKEWAVTDLLFAQVSTLDFTAQKSKIAVKNPLIRPPKDPRTLINMTSVEPLTPPCPPGPRPLRTSPAEGVSVPGKGVLGFRLPGLGSGLPALRQTEAGRKMKHEEEAQCVTSQKSGTDPAECYAKQDKLHDKPKSTPARHPGMGNQQMMLELKNKLKKNKTEKE